MNDTPQAAADVFRPPTREERDALPPAGYPDEGRYHCLGEKEEDCALFDAGARPIGKWLADSVPLSPIALYDPDTKLPLGWDPDHEQFNPVTADHRGAHYKNELDGIDPDIYTLDPNTNVVTFLASGIRTPLVVMQEFPGKQLDEIPAGTELVAVGGWKFTRQGWKWMISLKKGQNPTWGAPPAGVSTDETPRERGTVAQLKATDDFAIAYLRSRGFTVLGA